MNGHGLRHAGAFGLRGIWASVLLGLTICGAWRLQAQEGAAEPVGRGVLPAEVPADITATIAALPETWQPWGEGLAADLQRLYEGGGDLNALPPLRRRLATVRASLADPRYRSITTQLVSLDGSLTRRLDVVEVALNILAADPAAQPDLQGLIAGVETVESRSSTAGTTAIRAAFDRVRTSAPAPAAAQLERVLRKHYLNYNLRVAVSEEFLNKLIAEKRREEGPVIDCILGAYVEGCQTTITNVTVDLCPQADKARFDLVVNGETNSNTSGTTPQAVVYTYGNHYFTARKGVLFDGDFFATEPARIGVNANNYTQGATTKISRVPLLGGLADRLAVRAAENKRPESEAIAASRVQDRVLPALNSEVDKQFGLTGRANTRFQEKVVAALKEQGLYPDAKQYRSTDSHLFVSTRLMGPLEVGAGEPPAALNPLSQPGSPVPPPGGANVQLHQSLLNNSLDRMNLAGRTLTEAELRTEIEQNLSRLLDRPVSFIQPAAEGAEPEAEKAQLILSFEQADPIRIRIDNGQLFLTVRAAFQQEGREPVPAQVITVPLQFRVDGNQVVIERGDVSVAAVTQPMGAGVARQISMAGVIRRRFENALPPRQLDATVKIEGEGRKSTAVISDIRASDGWISITLR